jgi:cytosine/adenosine deaminase-related metal-dependent hydrolase
MHLGACGAAEEEGNPFDEEDSDESIAADKADSASGTFYPGCDKPMSPAIALGGTLLLPTGPSPGYVLVQDEKIVKITQSRAELPAGTAIVDTAAVISPGLIDLHNHVAYNFIPLWNAGRRYQNRYQWAKASGYSTAVKTPYNAVKNASHSCEAVKYGEFRAMAGGTTTIQGSVDLACTRSWVRNVEYVNFCKDHIRQNVLAIGDIKESEAQSLNTQFNSGATKAYLVHLAEGIDDKSRLEFEQLRQKGLLKPQVVGIHSTALTEAQIKEMGQIGMKIVWSPLSNLILYGKTTNIPAALAAGVKVALAPDWSPSGSANVLGELKVAARVNETLFQKKITDEQLFQMVTQNPADIVGMGDKLGRIAPGYYADLVVVRGDVAQPYRALINAQPADVLLTMISGKAYYGDIGVLEQLGLKGQYGLVDACGSQRGILTAESNPRIPNGKQSVEDLRATFTKDGVKDIIPLFQCGPAPEWSFLGISL